MALTTACSDSPSKLKVASPAARPGWAAARGGACVDHLAACRGWMLGDGGRRFGAAPLPAAACRRVATSLRCARLITSGGRGSRRCTTGARASRNPRGSAASASASDRSRSRVMASIVVFSESSFWAFRGLRPRRASARDGPRCGGGWLRPAVPGVIGCRRAPASAFGSAAGRDRGRAEARAASDGTGDRGWPASDALSAAAASGVGGCAALAVEHAQLAARAGPAGLRARRGAAPARARRQLLPVDQVADAHAPAGWRPCCR